ncbi:putative ferric-chelate reductase 1 isoform X2 [Takifugu rubripes]|uniref:putative ferric-chelate reductase 1 isoform X2 n=1 Tax=Takifugu rubripes TaxID=31033 RepID=UPI00114528B5|nr:putative ferric-chelate reductase 1 isoform X2 [Takifugu rubripes]
MDSKLYFTVTLVVLAWVSVATTQAQTTTASTNTMATANTTASTNTMATANTTASTSVTAAPNTTASTSVTAAPPLTPNNTVTPLETNLNNSECGNKTLCVSEPANCDPGSGSCSFFSARQKSGQNFEFALAGETDGYIAAVISSDTTLGGNDNDTTYVCFNNNGSVKFTGAILNNTQLTKQNVSANNVRGRVNGTTIQCVFDATLPALPARTTSRTIGVITGTYNNSTFGAANTVIRTDGVDLSSPTIVQNLATTNTTAAPNTTASTSVTAAPPLTPNNTVTPLETNLNNSGCGTQNLCVNEPANCDPGSGSCNFFSARQKSGQNFGFALAGETDGYIAAVLSSDTTLGGSDTTYVCFNNNGNVEFTGASLNNNQLTKQNVNANNVRGRVNGRKIQCVFDATLPALSARTTSRTIGVITGTYDNSAGTFGAANIVIRTNAVDLSSPNATVQNLATTNTTTNNAVLFRQTLIQALFISAGVMGLAVL